MQRTPLSDVTLLWSELDTSSDDADRSAGFFMHA